MKKKPEPPKVVIPDKLYFRIQEVAAICDLENHVIRFWEKAFARWLHPQRHSSGQRWFHRPDIEMVLKIKELLYEKQYTISGARLQLAHTDKVERTELIEALKISRETITLAQSMNPRLGMAECKYGPVPEYLQGLIDRAEAS